MADVEMADADTKPKAVSKAPKAAAGDGEGSNKKKFEVKKVRAQTIEDMDHLTHCSGML